MFAHGKVRRVLLGMATGAAILAASACGGTGAAKGHPGGAGASSSAEANSAATVTILPKNGSTGVDTSNTLKVSAAQGKLTQVAVTGDDGSTVDGSIAGDGSGWTPSGTLHTGTKYSVVATATDAQGQSVTDRSSFTTLTPSATDIANFNVDPGATYGVGMEVSLNFTSAVADTYKASVLKAITVTADPNVDVEGHWFGDSRVDFRPQQYWAPGTKVTLHLHLDGVRTGQRGYGKQNKDVSFTIGRYQVSVADNNAHTLTVYQAPGVVLKKLPASLGDADHTTYNGKMVIIEKDPTEDMNSQTVGLGNAYRIKDVPHAMRLTTSGTFVHGNYWRPASTFGSENTSHGCVGLQDVKGGGDGTTPAAWFYNHSLLGDVVQVVNSPDRIVQPDNGLNGWNMSWSSWTSN
ncbi:L,D-transpeptidase [Streptacidiphilus jiangxiensis]|uniref:Lipoprotein-anchoring transpeptidase ErfK/SrfK n=1 Tax=Streptacidiphilus jiangxiensis TaxID=235985 RepID=A0A1H7GCL0_STRJI|nr:Ig-like domain-containing protein [Streptacidiphilus jiangxiensis]SEK35993.1 Lipoprotein-anchoring transpeptidase ErfK/SrfK [Streptacidiphilus jiangxiensis]